MGSPALIDAERTHAFHALDIAGHPMQSRSNRWFHADNKKQDGHPEVCRPQQI